MMEYTNLGLTDLKVSRICLGTVFRSEMDEASCIATIHEAQAQGCNYLDCANIYRNGLSEQILGKAIKGRRDQFVVSTKVGAEPETGGAAGKGGLGRASIISAIEDSLRRLDIDYVDTYLCHFPDPDTPIDETLGAMDELVRQGKIRYPGCSNFESWRLCEALNVCDRDGLAPFVCNQVGFSLLDRRVEHQTIPYCMRRNVAVTLFATTVIGLLSGRYRYGRPPPVGTSWHRGPYNYRAAMTRHTDQVIAAVMDVAAARGKTPTQVAMAWCLANPGVTSVIIGADTVERVRENWGAVGWKLSDEELDRLNNVSDGHCLQIRKDCLGGWQDE